MYEDLILQYDSLVAEYKKIISDRFSKADFIEYNEILFSAHSCAIEGNSFSVDETRTLKEKGLGMIPHGKTLFEAFEILDHFQAYEYLLNNLDKPLTEELLKETHRLLTEHTRWSIKRGMMKFRVSPENIPLWICVPVIQYSENMRS